LTTWNGNNFSRDVLESLVGKYYGQLDLRGINLSGEDLSGKDLNHIDFFFSIFENTKFNNAVLNHTYFSESDIRGAKFDWAQMKEVYIDTVKFNTETSFLGVNLNSINFTLAVLLQDLAVSNQLVSLASRDD